jgi:hypothetical protein
MKKVSSRERWDRLGEAAILNELCIALLHLLVVGLHKNCVICFLPQGEATISTFSADYI